MSKSAEGSHATAPPPLVLRLSPVVPGDAALPPLVFHRGIYQLGRDTLNDFVLTGSGICAQHCRVQVGARHVVLESSDAGARVLVDGEALAPGAGARLLSGARIELGSKSFEVQVVKGVPTNGADARPASRPGPGPAAGTEEEDGSPFFPKPGQAFAGFKIEESLGIGGTAVVYRATRLEDKQQVALKILRQNVELETEAMARFYREAMLGGKLGRHPNVVRTLEVGRAGHFSYLVMEFVPGRDAQSLLDRSGPLSLATALNVIVQVARCLAFARTFNIIHRDIKPGNLLIGDDGCVRLLDMGLARVAGSGHSSALTAACEGMGTLAYVAPEQALDATTVDHRADIYSLGVTLFVLLTGVPPLAPGPIFLFAERLLNEVPPTLASKKPGIPAALSRAVAKCLKKDPADRFQEYEELLRELEGIRARVGRR